MRSFYLISVLVLLLGTGRTVAQTVLGPGDLAIVGVEFNVAHQCGSTFGTDDMFAVLALKNIENGTKIIMTDRAFLRSEDNCNRHIFRSAEGIAIFERTGGTLPAGTIFYVMFGGAPPIGLCAACSPGWTITLPTGSSPDMNTNGDQLFILQGDYQIGAKDCSASSGPILDVFEGNFIYAVSTNPAMRWLPDEAPDCSVGDVTGSTASRLSYFPSCFSECLRVSLVSDRGYLRNLPNNPGQTKEFLLGYIALDANWNNGSIQISPTSCLDASSQIETDFSKYKFADSDFNPGPINVTNTVQNGVWRGLVDDNWFNACNWSNFVLPDSTIDVVIPVLAFRNCVIDKAKQPSPNIFATCRNLTIESAMRTLSFTSDPVLRVYGNMNVAGGLSAFQAGSGTVELRGPTASSTLAANGNRIDFHNLRLNRRPNGKVDLVNVEARISNLLNLRAGTFLATGSGQLTVTNQAGGALTNSSGLPFTANEPNTWVECPLQRRITLPNTSYAFPVGDATNGGQLYTVNFDNVGDYTDLRVRYVPGPSAGLPLINQNEEGNENYNAYLDTGWWEAISTPAAPTNLGYYNLAIRPQGVYTYWQSKDYTENFGNASVSIAKAPTNSSIWSLDGKPVKTSHLNANATVERKDINTGFSKFAIVIDENKPFALNELSLRLVPEPGQGLRLDWEFDQTSALAWRVQRSTRLPQFETLAEEQQPQNNIHREVPVRTGSYLDRTAPCDQPVWYRLEIVEASGQATHSEIVEGRYLCANAPTSTGLRVYPNPFGESLQIEFAADEAGGNARLELIDALGRRAAVTEETIPAGALRWQLDGLPAGIYTLRITTPTQTYRLRVVAN